MCALHVIRLSENASTALPATSVTDGSIAYVIQVNIYLSIIYLIFILDHKQGIISVYKNTAKY